MKKPIIQFRIIAALGIVILIAIVSAFLIFQPSGTGNTTINITQLQSGQTITVEPGTTIHIAVGNVSIGTSQPANTLLVTRIGPHDSIFLAHHIGTATLMTSTKTQCDDFCKGRSSAVSHALPQPGAFHSTFQLTVVVAFHVVHHSLGASTASGIPQPVNGGSFLKLSSADNNEAFTVQVGSIIEVVQSKNSGSSIVAAAATNENILNRIATGINAQSSSSSPLPYGPHIPVEGGPFIFEAIASGTTTISGTIAPVCVQGMACPQYRVLFTVVIHVAGTSLSTTETPACCSATVSPHPLPIYSMHPPASFPPPTYSAGPSGIFG